MNLTASEYEKARRLGEICQKEREADGLDPYLPVLDKLLEDIEIKKTRPAGTMEILTSQIIGTVHAARTESFAHNFMPLLSGNSEFAAKWETLYQSSQEEGIREPIKAYEVFGRYFVEEGNKRVSVTKFNENPMIVANVTNLELDLSQTEQASLYEEYLKFSHLTGLTCILLQSRKGYSRLLKLIGASAEHPLDKEQRKDLLSLFFHVEKAYRQLSRVEKPKAGSGEALLLFVETYGYDPAKIWTEQEIRSELEVIWPDIMAWPDKKDAALLTQTTASDKKKILSLFREPLRAAFILYGDANGSTWNRSHSRAIELVKKELGSEVDIQIIETEEDPKALDEALSKAIHNRAEVVFTTNPLMLQTTNVFAAKYPKVRFLNCSLNPDTTDVRTYYAREYEVQFLLGMAAGMLTKSHDIGYIADYPVYGTIADINAFALGVTMVHPDAKVYLDWSSTRTATLQDFPLDIDILYVAGEETDPRLKQGKKFGLFSVGEGRFYNLAHMEIHWGVFYVRILRSILNNTYKSDEIHADSSSINYWLGFSNGLLDVQFSDELPPQSLRLVELVKKDMTDNSFFVFDTVHSLRSARLSLEEVVKMDWLVDGVVGSIPKEDDLMPDAEKLCQVHGVENARSEEDDAHEDRQNPSD